MLKAMKENIFFLVVEAAGMWFICKQLKNFNISEKKLIQ